VRRFSHIYRYPRGFAASTRNIGHLKESLNNLPLNEVRLIVATDSSAILGIGDQGFGGLAISIGKLTIYTAAGGVAPDKTLPVELDVGTDRKDLLEDPLYLGVRHTRLKGQEYFDFMDRFVRAVQERYPKAVIQWEDFSKDAAHAVLERYRQSVPSFNDDIQGTGAVALAGLISACRIKGEKLSEQRFLIHGAGAGGTGVAWAIMEGLKREGLSQLEALRRVFVLDAKGLLVEGRVMEGYKKPFAQPSEATQGWRFAGMVPDLLEAIEQGQITALLGLSGVGGCFIEPIVRAVHAHTSRPIVFPMSNPTANTEVLPTDVIAWTDGAGIVATGSPFADVHFHGRDYPVGQGNNAFIFPGLGFAAVLGLVRQVSDGMVLEGAYALADYTQRYTPDRVYPPVSHLREVSAEVATRVLLMARHEGLTREPRLEGLSPEQLGQFVRARMWEAKYLPFRYQRVGV
jgi:malate dehydrogenase (oxaloacetate-decarboxylating)